MQRIGKKLAHSLSGYAHRAPLVAGAYLATVDFRLSYD